MATGGVRTPGTNPAATAFSSSEIHTAADAAHDLGLKIAAHAHGVDGIATAARAGVDSIEHCSWVDASGRWGQYDEAVVELLADRAIFVCPTIGAGWARQPGLMSAQAPALQRMRRAGVRLVASSDAGAIPNLFHHRLADGVVLLGRCAGMSHAEALRAATSEAAAALGLEAECGALLEGMSADLMVVRGDPIDGDLEAVLCGGPPLAVCARGKLVPPCAGAAAAGSAKRPSWALCAGAATGGASASGQQPGLGASALCECNRR